MKLIAVLIVGLTLSGCLAAIPSEDYQISPHQGVARQDQERAQIVVFWQLDSQYPTYVAPIYQGQQTIGVVRSGTYFTHMVKPGRHLISVHYSILDYAKGASVVAQPGKTYYLEFIAPGFQRDASFALVSEEIAQARFSDLSMIEWTNHAAKYISEVPPTTGQVLR